jgi:PAS domain S-box-containing protein
MDTNTSLDTTYLGDSSVPTEEKHVGEFLLQIKSKSDWLMNYFLACYFLLGLLLATWYDTWLIGIAVSSLSLLAYYSAKWALPKSDLYQYVLSTVFGIFMAQFIYQMHGMFEMHFFAFIGSAILITYQNWKLQIPLAAVVIVHHATFGYLQYIGFDQVYFTQLDYMTLETFIIHGILATIVFFLCGLWAYNFKAFNNKHVKQSYEIGQLQQADKQKGAMIEERKASEDAIMQSEKRYRLVSENSFLGITWASPEGRLINVNDTFCKMLEYSREELMSKHFAEFSHPEDVERDIPFIEKMRRGEIDNYQTEKRFITKYGKTIWAELHLTSIKSDGKEEYRIAIIQDISSRKNAEEKLETTLRELETRVEERTLDITITNKALRAEIVERAHLSRELEAKNKDVTDSIVYAQRLQKALLPETHLFKKHFQKSFIINKPQDIVGGDFYWLHQSGQKLIIACVDCTGHGVPGAFMSIIGIELLNKIVGSQNWKHPSLVLELMDAEINDAIGLAKQEGVKDGMDMSLCVIDTAERKILFAGAMNSIVLASAGRIDKYRGSRFGLGGYMETNRKQFETQEIFYNPGDMLYMYTDGYQDQFGGARGKKFMPSQLIDLFGKVHRLTDEEQKDILVNTFSSWKGNNKQTDDVLVMGLGL